MPTPSGEVAETLGMLHNQRKLLRATARDLTEAQAAQRSTVSELTIGGLLNHVATTETFWIDILAERPVAFNLDPDQYRIPAGQTLAGLLDRWAEVARATERTVTELGDLDHVVALPEFPWAPGTNDHWTRRRVLLHVLREIAHHCGHADIIRESLDGANTTMQMAQINAEP